jgi:predicted AAA+ superfamily ATPase
MKETDRLVKETDRLIKETAALQQETAALQKETAESQKETARQMKETDRQMKETDRQIKEFNKRHGEDSNRFGEMVEYMVAPHLVKRFSELGVIFKKAYPRASKKEKKNDIYAEVDITLENSKKVMLVEVKAKLTTEKVKKHIKRLEEIRRYADLHGDRRTILGAVAGVVMTPNAKKYALDQGFYVIEPSGEILKITSPNGHPKEW